MVVTIKKDASKKEIEKALKKMEEHTKKTKGSISQFFGAAPLHIDGLEFQQKVRKEWH